MLKDIGKYNTILPLNYNAYSNDQVIHLNTLIEQSNLLLRITVEHKINTNSLSAYYAYTHSIYFTSPATEAYNDSNSSLKQLLG